MGYKLEKFVYKTLNPTELVISKLIVLSYEMSVYMVKLECQNQQGLVYDNERPMRFFSTQQIRDAFHYFRVEHAEMHHQSPYDEMIGNPASVQNISILPFSMLHPY